jgi:membrane-bound lytic murein transglycosylase B
VSSTSTTAPRVTSPDQLAAPASAEAVAGELVRVERALRTDGADPGTRLALGWAQQLAYGALSSHAEWADATFAALPADVAPIVRVNVDAAKHLESPSLGPTPTELPEWTIRTPQPPATLLADYHEAEARSGVGWQYLAAIHFVESRMGRIHGNSGAGAQGPMQFIPSTWATYGEGGNVDDDHDAILAAGRFLAANGGAADIGRALFAYNPSDDYVAAIEAYAGVMAADPRAYDGYYAWQVYVTTTAGTRRLPEGWTRP